jgi:hypothetical protein
MNQGNKGGEQRRAPAQQAQQPQPSKVLNDQIRSARLTSENTKKVNENAGKDQLLHTEGSAGDDPKSASFVAGAAFDEGRFTAGVVRLYEALLKEPIPEDMLRLVDQLGKQERK